MCVYVHTYIYICKDFIYLFLERKREGEREEEKHQCVRDTLIGFLSHTPTGDLAHNQVMCPDRESNQQPFISQAGTQSTEPYLPGHIYVYF